MDVFLFKSIKMKGKVACRRLEGIVEEKEEEREMKDPTEFRS